MFKSSKFDGILVCMGLGQAFLWWFSVSNFSILSGIQITACGIAMIVLLCTNYQCISHNFIHNKFFKWQSLNTIFSIVNSMALGMPQSMYEAHHINHHIHSNDRWNGFKKPRDRSSLYYYGENGEQEPLLRYTFMSYFRLNVIKLFGEAYTRNSALAVTELMTLLSFCGWLIWINYLAFFLFCIPIHFLGTSIASMENYAEHDRCDPSDNQRNSVSCYNRLYNFLWFNNGFHQEHHLEPDVHWTKLPKVKEQLLESKDRIVVKGCHLLGLLEK